MATAKKQTGKVAAPKAAAKPKRSTPKPSPEVLEAIEKKEAVITVKAGDEVKVYNHGVNRVLQGTVIAVHEGLRIDVLVSIPNKESASLPTVNHISKSGGPSDLFWDN